MGGGPRQAHERGIPRAARLLGRLPAGTARLGPRSNAAAYYGYAVTITASFGDLGAVVGDPHLCVPFSGERRNPIHRSAWKGYSPKLRQPF